MKKPLFAIAQFAALFATLPVSQALAMGTSCSAPGFTIEVIENTASDGAPVQEIRLLDAKDQDVGAIQAREITGFARATDSLSIIAGENGKTGQALLKLFSDKDAFGSNGKSEDELEWYGKAIVNLLDKSGKPFAPKPVAVKCAYYI